MRPVESQNVLAIVSSDIKFYLGDGNDVLGLYCLSLLSPVHKAPGETLVKARICLLIIGRIPLELDSISVDVQPLQDPRLKSCNKMVGSKTKR